MTRKTLQQMKTERLASMEVGERAEFDETYAAVRLALEFGEKVRNAREAAGLSQRALAARMGTGQAAVARLEAGGLARRSRRFSGWLTPLAWPSRWTWSLLAE